jgi:uncharacterized protein with HEPN domain
LRNSGAIEKAEQFVEGMDFEHFSVDYKTRFAVIRSLEIIGEASKKLPQTVKRQNPDLPWRDMAGIRDILIHEYFGIDLQVIWKTLQEDLPKLKPVIIAMLEKGSLSERLTVMLETFIQISGPSRRI